MATVEIFRQNLPIEPDLRNFIGFAVAAVGTLGGNVFAAAHAGMELSRRLRAAGAGSGYPLSARLLLDHLQVKVEWGDGDQQILGWLKAPPHAEAVAALRQKLQQSTEMVDPALLLERNLEMVRYLDEIRGRTEKEIKELQLSVQKHRMELWDSLRQAETDALTGLYNRRAFDDRIEQAFRRTLRQKREVLSLVLLDLDFFKQINDKFGHPFGDAYLNKMAHAMRDVIRADVDMAFRIGGDEFALLVFAEEKVTCLRAMQLLAAMDGKVSIGIVSVRSRDPEITLEEFIKRADDALYAAKRAGRGRIVVAGCNGRREGCQSHCGEAGVQ
jgi:diguanylate cyclase (GGDEF)-like protein